jgi:hypothetical protein
MEYFKLSIFTTTSVLQSCKNKTRHKKWKENLDGKHDKMACTLLLRRPIMGVINMRKHKKEAENGNQN